MSILILELGDTYLYYVSRSYARSFKSREEFALGILYSQKILDGRGSLIDEVEHPRVLVGNVFFIFGKSSRLPGLSPCVYRPEPFGLYFQTL